MNNRHPRIIVWSEDETVYNAFFGRGFVLCKIRYFKNTGTPLVEFRDAAVAEMRDLDKNTVLDFDAKSNVGSISVEDASKRANASKFSYEQVAAHLSHRAHA
jgi:uncharacterized protein YuzE